MNNENFTVNGWREAIEVLRKSGTAPLDGKNYFAPVAKPVADFIFVIFEFPSWREYLVKED